MKVTLKDGAPRHVGHVDVNVSKNGNTIEIGAVGVEPAPVLLEFYGGKLKVRLYSANGELITEEVISTVATALATTNPPEGHVFTTSSTAVVVAKKPTAQETVNSVFPPAVASPADEFDEAAFDAA